MLCASALWSLTSSSCAALRVELLSEWLRSSFSGKSCTYEEYGDMVVITFSKHPPRARTSADRLCMNVRSKDQHQVHKPQIMLAAQIAFASYLLWLPVMSVVAV